MGKQMAGYLQRKRRASRSSGRKLTINSPARRGAMRSAGASRASDTGGFTTTTFSPVGATGRSRSIAKQVASRTTATPQSMQQFRSTFGTAMPVRVMPSRSITTQIGTSTAITANGVSVNSKRGGRIVKKVWAENRISGRAQYDPVETTDAATGEVVFGRRLRGEVSSDKAGRDWRAADDERQKANGAATAYPGMGANADRARRVRIGTIEDRRDAKRALEASYGWTTDDDPLNDSANWRRIGDLI